MSQDRPLIEVPSAAQEHARPNESQWLILVVAFLGWMFDGMEIGLFSAVGRPVLQDLLGPAGADEAAVARWISYVMAMFLLGAACGGLVFGWLGDRIGRVRSMALSILAYSAFTGACYFVTGPRQLAALRFLAALGMGGEWALGVAMIVECWPEKFRPLLAGVIGAASNVGYLLIGGLVACFAVTPASWRWTMLVCATPAVLAAVIITAIPESKRWQQSVRASAARPLREIFTTRLVRPTLMAIALASVALIGTWGCVHAFLPTWADQLARAGDPPDHFAKGMVLAAISVGAIVGGLVSPLIGAKIGRRPAYFGMCLFSLLVCQFLYRVLDQYNMFFVFTAGVAGCAASSFYGWLPLYLPELFPTRVRATGQGISYNFGRIFAIFGVLGTANLMQFFDNSYPRACATMSLVYVAGMFLIWLAPETKGKPLPQ
ncbi:MAG: MFS transporter [Tepidisphaeraceae bacterium]